MADQASEGLLSPWLRNQRIKATLPYLKGRILDFGCGSGAVADMVEAKSYFGVEIDDVSIELARLKYPDHQFDRKLPASDYKFKTIIALAVIEHVKSPSKFLESLSVHLDTSPSSSIVLTTPHPDYEWIHDVGCKLGLFSKHASEEHEELLDRSMLEIVGKKNGLNLICYRRFLFGANQLAVFQREAT